MRQVHVNHVTRRRLSLIAEAGFFVSCALLLAASCHIAEWRARECVAISALAMFAMGGRGLALLRARELARRLKRESTLDPVSGTVNSAGLRAALEREVNLATRRGSGVTVIAIAMRNLVSINKEFDRAEGDAVVAAVAMATQRCLRDTDCLGRATGLAFIAVLPDAKASATDTIVGRMREGIASIARSHAKGEVRAQCELRAARWEPGESAEALCARALSELG